MNIKDILNKQVNFRTGIIISIVSSILTSLIINLIFFFIKTR